MAFILQMTPQQILKTGEASGLTVGAKSNTGTVTSLNNKSDYETYKDNSEDRGIYCHLNALNDHTVSDIFLATLMVWRLLKRCLVTAPETLISDTLQEHTWQIILTGLLP